MFENYPQHEHTLAQVQLSLFMLGMGATLSVRDFIQVMKEPRSLIVAAVGQVIVLPILAWGFTRLFGIEAGFAVGLILVAAMPGGTLSKVFTFLGRGNVALSITLSVLTTVLAIATVPVQLRWLAAAYIPENFEMPVTGIIQELTCFLLLPMLVGMFLARLFPRGKKELSRWCFRVGFVVVAYMVVGSLASERIRPGAHGLLVPVVIVLFCLAGQQLNMAAFYLFRWPRQDRLAAGIEVTMRNMNLALLLKPILFPHEDPVTGPIGEAVLFVVLFYAAVALIAGFPLALNHRRLWRREEALPLTPEG